MQIRAEIFTVNKRFPLTISRGTTAQTTNVWVRVEQDGIEGWGEASPFSLGNYRQSTEMLKDAIASITPSLKTISVWERQRIDSIMQEAQIPSSAQSAWIWRCRLARKASRLPLWHCGGLDRAIALSPHSVTLD
jgi:L-alanine-DL-glutamate epimerase-like enolase superfamily enzyme